MRKRLFPVDHEDVADSYYYLGSAFYDIKDYKSAIENYQQSLEMRKRLFTGDSQDIANLYTNLGSAFNGVNDYKSAIENHKQGLEMRKRLFPGDNQDVAQSCCHHLFAKFLCIAQKIDCTVFLRYILCFIIIFVLLNIYYSSFLQLFNLFFQ
jgi:tetratricopeptide (TPR) repeat protein